MRLVTPTPASTSSPFASEPLRASTPLIQRKCGCSGGKAGCTCDTKRLQRTAAGTTLHATTARSSAAHAIVRDGGRPLDPPTRSFMESGFGRDFSRVRIHADGAAAGAARGIDALAYTIGDHIVVANGEPRLGVESSRRLLAHELAHVVQQRDGIGGLQTRHAIDPPDSPYELAADRTAERVARGDRALALSPLDRPVVQRTMLCSKPLEQVAPVSGVPVIGGLLPRHAFVDDTGRDDCRGENQPGNYAVTNIWSGNFLRGCATKTDVSPDPRGKPVLSKPCRPKAGVTDLPACLRTAYDGYANPSIYSNVAVAVGAAAGGVVGAVRGATRGWRAGQRFGRAGAIVGAILGGIVGAVGGAYRGARAASRWNGPNSNTFAATLARACCADASNAGLGWVPGWAHAPAGPCDMPQGGAEGGDMGQANGEREEGLDGGTAPEPADAGAVAGVLQSPGGAVSTTPRPYSGPVGGEFTFTYQGGLPDTLAVGQRHQVRIGFLSQGVPCTTTVEFEVVAVDERTTTFASTNATPLDVAPLNDPPLVLRPRNAARLRR